MSLQDLRMQRDKVAVEMKRLAEKPDYDQAIDGAAYDNALASLNRLDDQIDRINIANEKLADEATRENIIAASERIGRDKGDAASKLYAKWLKGGDAALNADDWAAMRNAMSTTTGSEGGFIVPTTTVSSVIDALKAFGGMRDIADVIVTEGGGPMSYPKSDGTSEEGEIVAENGTATDADVSFDTVSLSPFKFSSKVVTVPLELLQDSAVDAEALVNGRLVMRLGRITERKYAVGSGSGEPSGLFTAAGSGVVLANGQGLVTTVDYDSLVNLKHSVDPAYRRLGCNFVMNDTSLRQISKIKDLEGRPIYMPGYGAGVPGGSPARLLDDPIVIIQHAPNMAANARSIAYGHTKAYKIRDVMSVQMYRFTDSAYVKRGQVGFLAWMRSGGALTDTGAVKVLINAAS